MTYRAAATCSTFRGHTDIKEEAFYIEDSLNFKNFGVQAGLRADMYYGLVSQHGIEPRIGTSYQIKADRHRTCALPTPASLKRLTTKDLILSSGTGGGGLASNAFGAFGSSPLQPGRRDQYNAGFQQTVTKRILVDVSYIWKYTHNAFDFDTLLNTPITFPIEWRQVEDRRPILED